MTTSGVTIIEMTRDTFISAALRKIGALSLGQSPQTAEITNAAEALNNLVAEFQTMGMPLWSRLTASPVMVAGQSQYLLGVGQATNIPFPLKILQAWTTPIAGGSKQILTPNAIDDFNTFPSSASTTGSPSQYMYQPRINIGELNIWPTPDAATVASRTLTISYLSPFEGFTSAGNTPYFPREWNNAIIYGLASLLAPEYGVPLNDRGMLIKEADQHLQLALDFGLEQASITFQPTENWDNGVY
jgi:hypothetical protein